MKQMDITTATETGAELATAIENEIGYGQSIVEHEMPAILVMTQAQYDSLMKASQITQYDGSKGRFFITKYNVMEIEVK
jgi:hypothetical protein